MRVAVIIITTGLVVRWEMSTEMESIKSNAHGKILEINKTATTQNSVAKIVYMYDAVGNRISKKTTKTEDINEQVERD